MSDRVATTVPVRVTHLRLTGAVCESVRDPKACEAAKGQWIEVYAAPEPPDLDVITCGTEWVWPVTDATRLRYGGDVGPRWVVCQHVVEAD